MPTPEEKIDEPGVGPPRQLGRYELLGRIGEGGMAEVHLARMRGPMNFEKVVVLKTIHPDLASQPQFLSMLFDEARVSALIKHPRVVDIYELGQSGDTYFIAMEYLDGQTLARLLAAGVAGFALPPLAVARVIADAAEGLHAAHELKSMSGKPMDLVHRDVSPGNIMVLYDGSVKVLDFGVAKARGRLTHSGARQLKGKLGYMAPEQLAGHAVDGRSDVYGLGVVMWEMLALRRLFATDSYQKLADTMVQDVAPPSSVKPEVPAWLDAICLRALAADPAARYQSAGELKRDLDTALHEAGAFRETEHIAQHMQKIFARHRQQRNTLLLQRLSGRSAAEVPPFELPEATAAPAAALAPMSTPTLIEELADSAMVEMIDEPDDADAAPAPAVSLVAGARRLLGHRGVVLAVAAVVVLGVGALVWSATSGGADATPRAAQLYREGTELFLRGSADAARARFEAAIAADARHAPAHRGLGLVLETQGDEERAVAAFERYLELAPGADDAEEIRQRIAALEE